MHARICPRASAAGVGKSDVLAKGIYEALVTTAAGLTVAIPCTMAFNLLVIKIDRIVLDMHRAGTEILTFLDQLRKETEGAPHGNAS